jgi:hypothetical protein
MITSRFVNPLRMIAAATASSIATLICIAQRHVDVVLSEPYTYGSPFRHKCGLLMIGCVIWAMLELTRYLTRAKGSAGGRDAA